MPITTISSREFNQDHGRAKKAAKEGPVVITDRGRPALVLLTIEDYERMTKDQPTLSELLTFPQAAEIDFEVPARSVPLRRPVFD